MSASRKVSPLRHLVNILSDTVAQIEEKYASANLEFPTFDEPIDEKDPAWILLSDSKVAPLSSVIVAAASQLIVSARHPMQALNDIAQSVSTLPFPSSCVPDVAYNLYWTVHCQCEFKIGMCGPRCGNLA